MEENDKPLTPEELEKQKKLVENLYTKEKEDRENYFKSFEEERKSAFEESKNLISSLISEKSFKREIESIRIKLNKFESHSAFFVKLFFIIENSFTFLKSVFLTIKELELELLTKPFLIFIILF